MVDRNIGRVTGVDSFRIIIELEKDIKTLYKSGFQDIYEIARINSYVVLPVGAEKIIALITKVKIQDETELESSTGVISLPRAKRYIVATMIGTIDGTNKYIQGVYNFPILDNPVWYITKEDLSVIFDYNSNNKDIDFKKDYFLPIGTSPAFSGFDIKINPDKFFSKHAAILGNTGSGKSCTLSTIIQSIFCNKFKNDGTEKTVANAHIIIFDTNGEYKKAFQFKDPELMKRVNAFTIGKDGIKIPYWFMNYDDFDYLFTPSEQTQAPILKKALGIAKVRAQNSSGSNCCKDSIIDEPILQKIIQLNDLLVKNDYSMRKFLYFELNDLVGSIKGISNVYVQAIYNAIFKLQQASKGLKLNSNGYVDGSMPSNIIVEAWKVIGNNLNLIMGAQEAKILSNDKDVDLPIYFDYQQLFLQCLDDAINEAGVSQSKYQEYVSSLRLRLSSYYTDERVSIPFMLQEKEDFPKALSSFLQYITGVLTNLSISEMATSLEEATGTVNRPNNPFTLYRQEQEDGNPKNVTDPNQLSQITIVDMSLLPCEVLENVAGLIGRLLIEFLQRIDKVDEYKGKRGSFPVALILEEAQNYIPEIDRNKNRVSIAKKIFERIAREGRKFGLSLVISSQRPSELSKTILSQCNTFIVHRLQNPEDQKYVRQLVSSANDDILGQLPILPQQHAIIMGDAVRSPVQVRINTAQPKPDSDDPEFLANWMNESNLGIDFDKVTEKWLGKCE